MRNHNYGGVARQAGAFSTSPLPIAGFSLIDADSAEDAVAIAARTPCAIADGVVEIWPMRE